MTNQPSSLHHPASGAWPAASPRWPASMRRSAWVGIAAQVIFVASWLAAVSWQGPRFSPLSMAISDMTAMTAPYGMFLVTVFALCGAATIWFAFRSVWPALRSGGRAAGVASIMLALSVAGLGDLLSPFERLACRIADPGCTTAMQISNFGGKMDSAITSIGLLVLVVGGFFLAAAMRRIPSWRAWAWPTQAASLLFLLLGIASAMTVNAGLNGLFERLFAAAAAAALATLGIGILRHSPAERP
jgi:hypothetical protein